MPQPNSKNKADQHTLVAPTPLPDSFLSTLLEEMDGPEVVGVMLGGSYARGEATQYSDVDFACFMRGEAEPRNKRLLYRDGRLVSIATKTVAGVLDDMLKPERAIWVVPGIGGCYILLDKDGALGRLMQEVKAFRWEPLQPAADLYASYKLMAAAEQVHKVLSELSRGNELALSFAIAKLFPWLTEAVAVQRGVMVKSDSTYYSQVQEAAGADSAWTRYHNMCAGKVTVLARGEAILHLYRQTVYLLRNIMQADHLEIVDRAAELATCSLPIASSTRPQRSVC